MVVLCGTAAPVLLKWFVSRDVSTGAPSFNGTIIPISISVFPLLVYLHSRKFIRSIDGAKSGVLVRSSRPILLPYIIGRSSSKNRARNASFPFVPLLHFLLLESKGDLSYLESFCGVLCLLFFRTLFSLPRDRSAKRERAWRMKIHLSHGGVCIFMLGVLLSNTKKIQFTQRLPLGSELNMGKERCSLRGLDHLHGPTFRGICGNLMIYKPSLTKDRLIFEHDSSLRAALTSLPIASYENGKLEQFLHRWMKNSEQKNFWLTMFPEKRYFFSIRETTSTTEVAIHTNLFTDLYASIGTGSSRTGGWYTTLMKLPFIFCIRIGFLLASSGGSRSLRILLKKEKLHWNRERSRCYAAFSREVNDLEGISKKLRRLFLELFHKQIFPSTPITSFSLFLSYIVITPLMIGFEKDFSCHSHLGSIRIPLLFPSPTEPFPRNEKEDGTLELYYLSAYCLPKILLLQLVGRRVIQISRVFCGFPMLQLLYQFDRSGMDRLNILLGSPVLTLLCGIHSRSALGITSSSGWNSSQNLTTSPTSLPLTVSRTSIETEWFHVPSSIGYSFLFVSLFPILVSICLKD
ncbi:hypothetical protein C5167_000919 [Papaver somniferum]|uniref:Cytochrome c-type biogenesis protein CcmF C-terminal domain-containing protein n=1 Tax=Papaver somniferum TaxID=3469 RepID=A0A4Y7KXI5_PAPSO|nr:hypothetical protein C5167_000919 [Papaver somniferum]